LTPLQGLTSSAQRILSFDVETVASGFADPEWVPQKITCVAWSWVGEDEVHVRDCGVQGLFHRPQRRVEMLRPLLDAMNEATMLTGHNILRFDLPVINAECLRLGLEPLGPFCVQDTMRVWKSKGFKKGQDNIGGLLKTPTKKQSMDWQQWEDAYEEKGWETIRSRASSDVQMHKEMRERMIARGMLRPPTTWRP
jgi:DNA polymerase elongation subunit (family B)